MLILTAINTLMTHEYWLDQMNKLRQRPHFNSQNKGQRRQRFMCISILIGQSKKTMITVAESSVPGANSFLYKGCENVCRHCLI